MERPGITLRGLVIIITIVSVFFLELKVTAMLQWAIEFIPRILLHLILLLTIIGSILMIFKAIVRTAGRSDRAFRALAAVLGMVAYFLGRALGVTVSDPILACLADNRWFVVWIVGALLPAIIGAASAWWIDSIYKKDETIAARLFVLASTLLLMIFIETYIRAASSSSAQLDRPLLPNVAFVFGMGIYVILRVRVQPAYRQGA